MSFFPDRSRIPAGPLDLVLPRPSRRPRGPSRRQRRAVAATIAIGLVCLSTMRAATQADLRQRSWGAAVPVWVVVHEVDQGHPIAADDLEVRPYPRAAVPDEAWPGDAASPAGRTALVALSPGEPLLRTRTGPNGISGPTALVGEGRLALAVPVDVPIGGLDVGSAVTLFSAGEAAAWSARTTADDDGRAPGSASGGAQVVAHDALVVAVDESSMTVAVSQPEAAAVVAALTTGPVIPALVGR